MHKTLSLVDRKSIAKDPRNLPFLYPSIPVHVYKDRTENYYRNSCLVAFEHVASMFNQIIVPAKCLHWERKKANQHRNVRLLGKSYYVLSPDDMTDMEYYKYEIICNGEE